MARPSMHVVPASFLAMLAGWLAPLVGLAIWQVATSGRTSDVIVSGFWTGLFALPGWLVIVPVMLRFGRKTLFGSLRWSWAGWALLGMGTYTLLVASWGGWDTLIILWYPAAMGVIAGPVFAWLIRAKPRATGPAPGESAG